MSKKLINGGEFRAFLRQPEFWEAEQGGDGGKIHAEGVVLEVDGQRVEIETLTPEIVGLDAQIHIIAGDVFDAFLPVGTLEQHFECWRAFKAEKQILES